MGLEFEQNRTLFQDGVKYLNEKGEVFSLTINWTARGDFMARQLEESSQLQLRDDDPGLVTTAKVISAVERIVAHASPQRVVAFGSRARGDHRRDSDLDLAVIVDKYDPRLDRRPIWRADIEEWMDMDLLVYDVEREKTLGESPLSLQHEVLKEGVVLYDRETGHIDRAAAARLV